MEYHKDIILLLSLLTLSGMLHASKDIHSNQDAIPKFGTRLKKLSSNLYQDKYSTASKNQQLTDSEESQNDKKPSDSRTLPNIFHRKAIVQSLDITRNDTKYINNKHLTNSGKSLSENETKSSKTNDTEPNLMHLPNLQLNRIEPYWPFSNITSTYLINNLKVIDGQTAGGFPPINIPDRFKDTTFFFSHVGPNSFEYRAQFHHNQESLNQPKEFNPFVNEFPEFPKFPTIPFPDTPDIFQRKPKFPTITDFKPFNFPPLFPPTKRAAEHKEPIIEVVKDPVLEVKFPSGPEIFNKPQFNAYNEYNFINEDRGLKWPKIFKFNDERINIEEFEREKKLQLKINALNSNQISEPENVQRNQLLILHGGIFTVKEPPLYHRKVIRKRRQRFRTNNNQIV